MLGMDERQVKMRLSPLGLMAAAGLALFGVLPAAADDATIIVNRMDRGVELFISAPADLLFDLFQTSPDLVPMKPGGGVDFAAFQKGTWGIGDAMLANAPAQLGDGPALFEAMSFMLHPEDSPMPFEGPIDGLVAIGVCNVIRSQTHYALSDLTSYVGFYAHQRGGAAPIRIDLPAATETSMTITVKDFGPGTRNHSYQIILGPEQSPELVLNAAPAKMPESLFSRAALWISGLYNSFKY